MQGLQMTWPHGIVSMALRPLLKPFLQAGHMRLEVSPSFAGLDESEDVLKVIGIRVLRDKGCVDVGEEPGQNGWSLTAVVAALVELGVRDGTQKDGRDGFEDYE